MPAALDVDREAVKTLVRAVGVRAAAREMGLSEATVQAWSARFGWLAACKPTQALPASLVSATVATKTPSDALTSAMEDLSTRSRIGFAKASARVAEKLAGEEDVEKVIAAAGDAHQWAKTAALAHGWQSAGAGQVNVAVALRIDME